MKRLASSNILQQLCNVFPQLLYFKMITPRLCLQRVHLYCIWLVLSNKTYSTELQLDRSKTVRFL